MTPQRERPGVERVRRNEFTRLVDNYNETAREVAEIQAELMGDDRTKRPSLRDEHNQRFERIEKMLVKLFVAIVGAMIAKFIADWYFLRDVVSQIHKP